MDKILKSLKTDEIIEREYFSQDKTLHNKENNHHIRNEKQLYKDVDACLRCGFNMEMILYALINTDNKYKNIIKLDEIKKKLTVLSKPCTTVKSIWKKENKKRFLK
jgi:hypothetical protein